MAEVRFLDQDTQGKPVLLLDDVLSELDDNRADVLMEVMNEFEQVILTSARRLDGERLAGFERLALDP